MKKAALLKKANCLPEKPGVYTMYNSKKAVIYVGKAKNLKNRVTTYFRNGEKTAKTQRLVAEIDDFQVVITASELEALLTECSLIRLHSPFYNILLKNGRGYPFIRYNIENGFPILKLEYSRVSNGRYFGPYISGHSALLVVKLLNKTFKLPDCSSKKRKKPCLNYHINRCLGYCMDYPTETNLKDLSESICSVLEGRVDEIYKDILSEMEQASENLDYEKAADLRDKSKALNIIAERQRAPVIQNRSADYISYKSSETKTCVFILRIRKGYIVGERCDIFKEPFSSELFREYIERFYSEDNITPKKIYIPEIYECTALLNEWLKGALTTPRYACDKDLLEVSTKNATERLLQSEGKTQKALRNLNAFCEFTSIQNAELMEIYDVSMLAGTDVVCGMISCNNGELDRSKYRKFKIGKLEGNDDTAFMSEAVSRRFERYSMGDEKFSPLPNVIICDGGLGQIHAVEQIVFSYKYDIKVIGLKKDYKHKTKAVVFSNGTELLLAKNPEVFAFCGRLQEEVHRFAISYHKLLRDKKMKIK